MIWRQGEGKEERMKGEKSKKVWRKHKNAGRRKRRVDEKKK